MRTSRSANPGVFRLQQADRKASRSAESRGGAAEHGVQLESAAVILCYRANDAPPNTATTETTTEAVT